MRRVTEKIFGSLKMTRRLPRGSGAGKIVTTARAGGLKYVFRRASDWDPILLSLTKRLVRPGDVVWDIGANVGLFTVAAAFHAGRTGHIYSMEADVETAALLLQSARLSSPEVAPITVLPIAVADAPGFTSFNIANRARAANALSGHGSTQTGGVLEKRIVPAFTLDGLLKHLQAPQMLKIDVEGAEDVILEGAGELLAVARPVIFCEVHSSNVETVSSRLLSNRYLIWSGDDEHWNEGNRLNKATWNTVAIPFEKASAYCGL